MSCEWSGPCTREAEHTVRIEEFDKVKDLCDYHYRNMKGSGLLTLTDL